MHLGRTFTYERLISQFSQSVFYQVLNTVSAGVIKDTHRETAPSNKTPALRKSTNMSLWAVGTLNQLFIRGS